jgi:hypothetical protein
MNSLVTPRSTCAKCCIGLVIIHIAIKNVETSFAHLYNTKKETRSR